MSTTNGYLQERAYSYTYDAMNRLKSAQHHRQLLGAWASLSDYTVDNLTYDKNGNIESLDRKGTLAANMDALGYTYDGNQLLTVTDNGIDDEGFKDGNAGSRDYFYDANGNMIKDLNKGITHIAYNHLNLPESVEKGADNYIDYIYDAAGVKLAQEIYEDGALTRRTDYIGAFIYEGISGKALQLIRHEEGRIVKHAITGAWEYQYYLKDHLGNNRVVFTTLPKTHIFKATMESQAEEQADDEMFVNITDIPVDTEATSYDQVQRLLAGKVDGAGITLPVYPGDKISMKVQGFYRNGDGGSTAGLDALITAVAGIFSGVDGGTPAEQRVYDAFETYYDPTLGGVGLRQPTAGDIAAYLNYILFDKNMNSVQDGFVPVDYDASGTAMEINIPEQVVSEEGILYVYLTNESNAEVYFDDLEIEINEHPVVQRDDYYPFGLTFNSWQRSTAKENKYLYNGKEFENELNIEWYDYGARMYMPDIGRWNRVDPIAEKYMEESPYNYGLNNPIRFIDPDGMEVIAKDEKEQELIKSTVSEKAAGYLKFNKKGRLKKSSVRKALRKMDDDASENLKNLANLVESNDYFQVQLSDDGGEIDLGLGEDSEILGIIVDGSGILGKFIEREGTSEDPHRIAVNNTASEEKQVETTAHEAYGHAYFYNKGEYEYAHIYERHFNEETMRYERVDTNKKLDKHIKRAEELARRYYRARQKEDKKK